MSCSSRYIDESVNTRLFTLKSPLSILKSGCAECSDWSLPIPRVRVVPHDGYSREIEHRAWQTKKLVADFPLKPMGAEGIPSPPLPSGILS